jgi:hypothetical protein
MADGKIPASPPANTLEYLLETRPRPGCSAQGTASAMQGSAVQCTGHRCSNALPRYSALLQQCSAQIQCTAVAMHCILATGHCFSCALYPGHSALLHQGAAVSAVPANGRVHTACSRSLHTGRVAIVCNTFSDVLCSLSCLINSVYPVYPPTCLYCPCPCPMCNARAMHYHGLQASIIFAKL